MENIPTPPIDLIFYKWLAGILAASLIFLIGWGIKRFVDAVDKLVSTVADHEGRIISLEEKDKIVKYRT